MSGAGEDMYCVQYPKYKRGGFVVKKVMQDPKYGKISVYLSLGVSIHIYLVTCYISDEIGALHLFVFLLTFDWLPKTTSNIYLPKFILDWFTIYMNNLFLWYNFSNK